MPGRPGFRCFVIPGTASLILAATWWLMTEMDGYLPSQRLSKRDLTRPIGSPNEFAGQFKFAICLFGCLTAEWPLLQCFITAE